MTDHAQAMRDLLRAERQALLSTISLRHPGYPFGSVVPYALWTSGEPLLYLSQLAAHTQNLMKDPRCSLLVSDSRSTAVQPARATLVGTCAPLDDQASGRGAFAARHPDSEALALPGFAAFLLEVEEIRWVGGFAAAAWLAPHTLR
jgi:hypothetical protein